MTPATRGWISIAAFVLLFNALSRPGGTLSEQMDTWINKHPLWVRLGIAAVALHLANAIDPRLDPIHHFFTQMGHLLGKLRRRT